MGTLIVRNAGPLNGIVDISGAKNAVLPIMAATLLTDEECEISEVPMLRDVEVMLDILQSLGATVTKDSKNGVVRVKADGNLLNSASYSLAKKMRASVLTMGPLLARTGVGGAYLPGGCAIGTRPIDLHLKGFKALGAEVNTGEELGDTYVEARSIGLHGAEIYLDFPSVGATENIIMAAVFADGNTIIENVAQEPEIVDLTNFLNKMGAKIKGAGTDVIKIEGVQKLHGCKYSIIPDRIEMGTFMVAAAITRGDIFIRNGISDYVRPVIAKLKECGVVIEDADEGMRVRGDVNPIISTGIKTLPYPGFHTDMQAQFMALLTTAHGSSVVIETVFENRFMHVRELNKLGASITTKGKTALVQGQRELKGRKVAATDLRAGAALVLAGLVASGKTAVSEIYHIERGYENFLQKFKGLGADITKEE